MVEEVVVDADARNAEDIGEQLDELLLARVARRSSATRAGRRLGVGQRPAVELSAREHGEPVEHDECGGDHVARQLRGQVRAQVPAQRGRIARGRRPDRCRVWHHVRDKARAAHLIADGDGGLVDVRMPRKDRFDLSWFDPEAADLDLLVDPAEEVQGAVAPPAGQVAGAVQPRTRRAVRIRDESFRRQPGLALIAPRYPVAGQVQLAGHTRRQQPQRGVEHVRPGVQVRPTDRQPTCRPAGFASPERRVDRHLGRPVRVHHHPARRPPRQQVRRHLLGPHHQ